MPISNRKQYVGIHKRHRRLAGSALISALFIMTLVAIAATAMGTRLQLDIYHTRIAILSDKLFISSQAISFWATSELSNNKNKFGLGKANGELLNFPIKLQKIYPDVVLQGALFDLQSRFNLNNLSDKKYYLFFDNLLQKATPKVSKQQRNLILQATRQWISNYEPGRGQDEYIRYYLQQKPPYNPGQQPLQTVSEFRLIRGVDAKIYNALEPFLIALPEKVPLNINTASPLMLSALGDGLNENQLKELLDARGEKGFKDLKDIAPLLEKFNIRSEVITLESQYFMSVASAKAEDLSLLTYTLFKRQKDKNGNIKLSIITQSINTL